MSNQDAYIKDLEENGSKVYQIELTCAELEFVKDMLMGIDEWMRHITGDFRSYPQPCIEFKRGLERIRPEKLADKIFKQFYDEYGEYR